MKRAFCEPGNIDVNPPLTIAREVALGFLGQLVIHCAETKTGFESHIQAKPFTKTMGCVALRLISHSKQSRNDQTFD